MAENTRRLKAYFTSNGVPATGLSAKISIINLSNDTVVVNADSMIESTAIQGLYYYDFDQFSPDTEYIYSYDGGSTITNPSERYLKETNDNFVRDVNQFLGGKHGTGRWEGGGGGFLSIDYAQFWNVDYNGKKMFEWVANKEEVEKEEPEPIDFTPVLDALEKKEYGEMKEILDILKDKGEDKKEKEMHKKHMEELFSYLRELKGNIVTQDDINKIEENIIKGIEDSKRETIITMADLKKSLLSKQKEEEKDTVKKYMDKFLQDLSQEKDAS